MDFSRFRFHRKSTASTSLARTKSREKRKKHFKLCNPLSKFFEEARITRSIWNFTMLLFTRPLPRDGGMAEDHGAPEAEQLPRVWTRGRKEIESRQGASGAKSP